ncbi:hypothetical protein [Francisella frigiditurris]|uniref:Uncharacterized protein n=1 Tax=Francisella frigiditurris TaxID=1542390 RepID=A0A1J0KVS1_9GAMM|nr:hypothetical protein [Francisella frigiditurris]APC97702.1 hypothetical protein KX01_919 [Francisella frigiditurris]
MESLVKNSSYNPTTGEEYLFHSFCRKMLYLNGDVVHDGQEMKQFKESFRVIHKTTNMKGLYIEMRQVFFIFRTKQKQ